MIFRQDIKNSDKVELDKTPTSEEEKTVFYSLDDENKLLQNQRISDENSMRKAFYSFSRWAAGIWYAISFFVIIVQFIKPCGYSLQESEFIAVISTSFATAIALYLQVGKGIFRKD